MKATTSIQGLEERIEQLVREHIAATRTAATAAVTRGFTETVRSSAPAARRTGASAGRSAGRRRTAEEVADLAERFCAAVHVAPGAKMTTLAAVYSATPRELIVAVGHLRRAGRVRTVGGRQHTKYFPAAAPRTPRDSEPNLDLHRPIQNREHAQRVSQKVAERVAATI